MDLHCLYSYSNIFFTTVSSHLELKLWCQHERCSNILAHVRKGEFGMVFKGLESYPVLFSMNGALHVNVKFLNNFFLYPLHHFSFRHTGSLECANSMSLGYTLKRCSYK